MPHDPHLELQAVLSCVVTSLDATGSVAMLASSRRLRGLLDRFDAEVHVHLDSLHAKGESISSTDAMTVNDHVSPAEAGRRRRRAGALDKAKEFADALADGTVNAEHADALANATSKLDEQLTTEFFGHEGDLLSKAKISTPSQFSRHCRELVARLERDQGVARAERQRRQTRLTRSIDADGMYTIHGRFHPELGARIFDALDHEVKAMVASSGNRDADRAQLAAEALGTLLSGGHQMIRPVEADITVIVDAATLASGLHEQSVCETGHGVELAPGAVRRLLCEARITIVTKGGDGIPLHVGREQRLANRAQRRALRTIYRTCAVAGCDVQFGNCEMHHIHEWEHGGRTDLDNLIPLCSRHHHVIHEHGWRLHLAPDRTLTITGRDGATICVERPQIRAVSSPTSPAWPERVPA